MKTAKRRSTSNCGGLPTNRTLHPESLKIETDSHGNVTKLHVLLPDSELPGSMRGPSVPNRKAKAERTRARNKKMTIADVRDIVSAGGESDKATLAEMFRAVYKRSPDQDDWADGVYSLIVAGLPQRKRKKAVNQRRKPKKKAKTKKGRRNPAPPGYSRVWYQRGFRAGVLGQNGGDYVKAWHATTGKPGDSPTHGKRIDAQEAFYLGYHDGERNRPASRNRKPKTRKATAKNRKPAKKTAHHKTARKSKLKPGSKAWVAKMARARKAARRRAA